LNPTKKKSISDDKPIVSRRTSSRISVSSITNLSHRQSLTTNPKVRSSRAFSRTSFSHLLQDNLRLLKSMHQETSETIIEPIKNGIHVEFKLSTQDEQTKQQSNAKIIFENYGVLFSLVVLFDVPKPNIDFDEDIITSMQNKCKRLLAEAKQRMYEFNFYFFAY
jgi:hypothetical protein